MKKPTLAAVLIVKNEADNLRKCLASLDGLVDEIVILDSGSQDETPAIAAAIYLAECQRERELEQGRYLDR